TGAGGRDRRGGDDAEDHRVRALGADARDDRGLEHRPGAPRVAPDDDAPGTGRAHGGTADRDRRLDGDLVVRQPAHPVGAEPDRHGRVRCGARRAGQRFEYWGALRAFLSPYFLDSFSRASRERNPARFSTGRSSGSIATSPRAMPRRTAPAWPVTPPPWMVASMSYCSPVSVSRSGSERIIRCVAFGK